MLYDSNINNIKRSIKIAKDKNIELGTKLNWHSNIDIDKLKQEYKTIQERIVKNKTSVKAVDDEITESCKKIYTLREHITEVIKSEIKHNRLKLSTTRNKNTEINKKARIIKTNIKTLINPLNWSSYFSSEQTQFRHKYKELQHNINNNRQLMQTMFKTIGYFEQNIISIQPNINEYLSANVDEILNNISKLQKNIDVKNSQKSSLFKNIKYFKKVAADLKVDIDKYFNIYKVKAKDKIYTPQKKLIKIKKEITPLKEKEKLTSDNMLAYGDISRAIFFCKQLDTANNDYERAKIHKECELELGEGSPKEIIKQKNKVIISNENNIKKLKHRIADIKRKEEMDIHEVIIDGNNMCYEGDSFIGLLALKAVIPELQKYYKVTIIFDSIIRKHLGSGDKEIKSEFNGSAHVHIVSTQQYADETILNLSSGDHHTFVISNDRYGDYPDKEVKQNGRLIRFEIIKNRILINDLDINISWGQ